MAARCASTKSPCRVPHATRGRWAHDVDRHAHGHWRYPRHLYAHTGYRGSAHEVVVRRAANSSATVRIGLQGIEGISDALVGYAKIMSFRAAAVRSFRIASPKSPIPSSAYVPTR